MIYLFVNLKEPFVNPSKTNYQVVETKAVLCLFKLYHFVLAMVAQIIECLVYVHKSYNVF